MVAKHLAKKKRVSNGGAESCIKNKHQCVNLLYFVIVAFADHLHAHKHHTLQKRENPPKALKGLFNS